MMAKDEKVDAETTLVVILGASSFPNTDLTSMTAFGNSAKAFKEYLLDPQGFGLPETNIRDLFDSPKSATDLRNEIARFLDKRGGEAQDLIVYYVGHGDFSENRQYCLAIHATQKDDPYYTSLPIEMLANIFKEHARYKRKYLILDCCFSAAAYKTFQSAPLTAAIEKTLDQFAASDTPDIGTALLCAAGPRDTASTPTGERFTMFSGAMINVLKHGTSSSSEILSLGQLCERIWAVILERHGDLGVRPQQQSPDQTKGDVGKLSLFPIPGRKPGIIRSIVPGDFYRALDPQTFVSDRKVVHCVIVTSEALENNREKFPIEQHVRRAWEHHGNHIISAVDEYRTVYHAQEAFDDDYKSQEEHRRLSILPLEEAFTSTETLKYAVAAMCQADVVVFDITGFQPGAMFLLGVRSVTRRGVTVCSLGGDYFIGSDVTLPFNLQGLNLAAHSEEQVKKGPNPLELLARKIAQGFKELGDLPHYLDLPAYDSVRRLGLNSDDYRPVGYDKRVLFLCPFGKKYTHNNWETYLSQELSGKLKQRLNKDFVGNSTEIKPQLVRLLDLETPRLVSQTLYESIRLTEMCVIDWTNLRENVIYEMGVRMATNPLGGVHIVEERSGLNVIPSDSPSHTQDMMRLFPVTKYRCEPGEIDAYDQMINAFEASLNTANRGNDYLVYNTVGNSFDRAVHPVALPVVEELVRGANLLTSDDVESSGISPVLYHDVSNAIAEEAYAAAIERRLAAWLYIDGRYKDPVIEKNHALLTQFRTLGAQVRRWLRRSSKNGDKDLANHISSRMQQIRAVGAMSIHQLIASVKAHKEEAKLYRDEEAYEEAIEALKEAVAWIDESDWERRSDIEVADQKTVAWHLADCLGMMGGNARRLGRLEEALKYFKRGGIYEIDRRFEINSSYNLVNAIVIPIENRIKSASEQKEALAQAVSVLQDQVFGKRRMDRWAWADLGQCLLLLGDRRGAKDAYLRFMELGDEESVKSAKNVLNKLHKPLKDVDEEIADAIVEGISQLEKGT